MEGVSPSCGGGGARTRAGKMPTLRPPARCRRYGRRDAGATATGKMPALRPARRWRYKDRPVPHPFVPDASWAHETRISILTRRLVRVSPIGNSWLSTLESHASGAVHKLKWYGPHAGLAVSSRSQDSQDSCNHSSFCSNISIILLQSFLY